MRLLFISHLFPDGLDPGCGSDSIEILAALADRWEIRAVALRPVPLGSRGGVWHPRAADVALHPEFIATPRLPIFGTRWNHRLAARALRKPLDRLRRDWPFDAVLCSSLHPDACAVSRLVDEFRFRFVTLGFGTGADRCLGSSLLRKMIASHLSRAAGVVTSSTALIALLSKAGFRKERMIAASALPVAAEACHRLLLPTRG
jgi:hypothetical protein